MKNKEYEKSLSEIKLQILNLQKELNEVKETLRIFQLDGQQLTDSYFVQMEYLCGVYSLLPNLGSLPPTRGWSVSPDFLLKLTKVVLLERPKFILELGSGVSTLVINACIQKNGLGKLVSVDHDSKFANMCYEHLMSQTQSSNTTIVFCPLKKYILSNESWQWYNIDKLVIEDKIDLLIIDGPPRVIQDKSRYPAIPILLDKLAKSSKIIIDDYKRNDEQEIVKLWISYLTNLGYKVELHEYLDYEKGMAILDLNACT